MRISHITCFGHSLIRDFGTQLRHGSSPRMRGHWWQWFYPLSNDHQMGVVSEVISCKASIHFYHVVEGTMTQSSICKESIIILEYLQSLWLKLLWVVYKWV